jgi:hypothetical protein
MFDTTEPRKPVLMWKSFSRKSLTVPWAIGARERSVSKCYGQEEERRLLTAGRGGRCRTGVALVSQVEDGADGAPGSHVPQGLADVVHVDGVEPEVGAPQELHLLVEVLVDGTADEARRCVHITHLVSVLELRKRE